MGRRSDNFGQRPLFLFQRTTATNTDTRSFVIDYCARSISLAAKNGLSIAAPSTLVFVRTIAEI